MKIRARGWAFLVGVSSYKDNFSILPYCDEFIIEFAKTLLEDEAFSKSRMKVLVSNPSAYVKELPILDLKESSRNSIIFEFDEFLSNTTNIREIDTIIIYFTCHGGYYNGENYVIPHDAHYSTHDAEILNETSINLSKFKSQLYRKEDFKISANIFFIVDACRDYSRPKGGSRDKSGSSIEESKDYLENMIETHFSNDIIEQSIEKTNISYPPGLSELYSCHPGQKSHYINGVSVFSFAFLNFLKNRKDSPIYYSSLLFYLEYIIPKIFNKYAEKEEIPVFKQNPNGYSVDIGRGKKIIGLNDIDKPLDKKEINELEKKISDGKFSPKIDLDHSKISEEEDLLVTSRHINELNSETLFLEGKKKIKEDIFSGEVLLKIAISNTDNESLKLKISKELNQILISTDKFQQTYDLFEIFKDKDKSYLGKLEEELLKKYPIQHERSFENYQISQLWIAIGLEYIRKEDFGKAKEKFENSLKFYGKNSDALNNLGEIIYYLEGNIDSEAETLFRKAILYDPNHSVAYFNLGNIFKDKNLLDKALSEYKNSINANENTLPAYINLGIILKDLKDKGEAEKAFNKAIEIFKDKQEEIPLPATPFYDFNYFLAMVYYNYGLLIENKNSNNAQDLFKNALSRLEGRKTKNAGELRERIQKRIKK